MMNFATEVSASLFTSDKPLIYAEQLKFANIDYFHLDFVEGRRGSFQLNDINTLDKFQVPLDVHLICSSINKDIITLLNNSSTKILSVQYENLVNCDCAIDYLLDFYNGFGFAVSPNTNIELLYPYRHIMNHILVMCSTPGVSGAKFLRSSFDFIKQIKSYFPNTAIYVDGGIDDEKYRIMCVEGVSIVVFGSYLYKKRNNLQGVINALRNQ